jgi:OTU domain-containing protein 6
LTENHAVLVSLCLQADGHCLYRSLEDQLEQTAAAAAADSSSSREQYNYQQLRELAAEYIREHK